jgi:glycosyltransferase involved in cell wall biosynthesis
MSRILFTSTQGAVPWAGSEVLWYQAASLLKQQGHEVAAMLPLPMRVPATRQRLAAEAIQVIEQVSDRMRFMADRISRRFRPTEAAGTSAMLHHARRWKADIVVISQASCWGAYTEMLGLAKAGIPYVCISQLNTPFNWPGDLVFEAVGEAFAKAKAAVFVSRGNLDLFQNQVSRKLDNAHVIYNPPSFDVSQPCGPPPDDVFRLLNVARIDPGHKGQDLLLGVLALPKWRERDVKVAIAGGGNRRWIEQLIASKGLSRIELLGHVSDLRHEWERASFGIFPSRYEGMPLAMIEGMALGRAVIATDVAGHAEWIEDGTNGFLAAGTSVSCLDSAMERAWVERSATMGFGVAARMTYNRMMPREPSEELADMILRTVS